MSILDNSTLRRRFAAIRPGRDLVTILDAALPVTTILVDVLGQERKDLPLTEEFVLRLVDAGIADLDDMAAMLGIDRDLVEMAATEQFASGNLLYRGATSTLTLTPRGSAAVLDAKAIRPVEASLPFTFDRLTWSVTDYPTGRLVDRREAEEEGMLFLQAQKSARPSLDDVTVERINELLTVRAEDSRVQVLTTRKIRVKRPKYLPVKLLVFADPSREDTDIAVVIEGDLSETHDAAVAHLGGAVALGIEVSDERVEPAVDLKVLEILSSHQARDLVEASTTSPVEPLEVGEEEGSSAVVPAAPEMVDRVEMYEHADILSNALRTASRRLLILSPWIQGSVVNTNFVSLLESRLRAKTRVHIAYGYSGPKGQSNDENAIRRLENLEKRFPQQFSLVRLKNSHAKVLIFDDTMITTSFNWLSFKGSKSLEYRIEEGLRVRIPAVVEDTYQEYLRMIVAEAADDEPADK